jgi:glycosyltransferase involved in cell wall biosynthesis
MNGRICVGIHVYADPDRLRATLAHLRANTDRKIDVILLADAPEPALQRVLGELRDLPQSVTDQPSGASACFNRLLRHNDADLKIFLEAGALVGPGWLDRMLAALDADSSNGLAGPSTNRSWNVQEIFPNIAESAIAKSAAAAQSRFGGAWQALTPLHCLADFCYAVRREVADAIGGADEAYGLGPCWEMDYSIRAARAGYRAVWAQGAFVYRRPPAERRRRDEERLLEANKHRYQDKFCGLMLSGERTEYVPHCRGDACSHFAPPDRIRIRQPFDGSATVDSPTQSPAVSVPPSLPLVSCIMPTRERRDWMHQAIAYFERQDYPNRELIIVQDGADDYGNDLPCDPRIRHVHIGKQVHIGAKRNRACELARGAIIAHWDDDDWYSPDRLTTQIAPLLTGAADITGLTATTFFDLDRWEFWGCTPQLHQRLFVRNVHGGTLVFWRHLFGPGARYPDTSLAEDAAFLQAAIGRGARLQAVAADNLFLYLRHGANSWTFQCGQHLDPHGWQRIDEPASLAPDRAFYAVRSLTPGEKISLPPGPLPSPVITLAGAEMPLVSCIMPTRNRRGFIPQAIAYFLKQDYPRRELVILDDGDDAIADLVPDMPQIRYVALPERMRLGSKRNAAIEAGSGDIIVHWDDDDWMGAQRITRQVHALLAENADICGSSEVRFCEIATGRLSIYRYPRSNPCWLYGATLCYRRALWRQKPFEPLDIGEDTRFVWARPQGQTVDLGEFRDHVAIVHAGNTSSPRPLSGRHWSRWNVGAEQALGDDWAFYERMHHDSARASSVARHGRIVRQASVNAG